MLTPRADVLVVGAGPAGGATAAALARHGLRTLLVDGGEPGATHDVALSASAMDSLRALGIAAFDGVWPVERVDVRFGDGPARPLPGVGAAVCDREWLRTRLRGLATDLGAALLPGRMTRCEPHPDGHRAMIAGGADEVAVLARHVVLATGSLPGRRPHGEGMAVVQRFALPERDSRMLLHLTPPSPADPHERPAGIWILPAGPGRCTVGAVRIGDRQESAADLLASAIERLAGADPAFATARPLGELVSGPVSTGFAPALAGYEGRLLVGDAAGLVNPFTGEGLGYAVQSALLAADAIAAHPDDPGAAREAYVRRLARAYVGHFETARHAARRYHLAWRVLAATAHSDQPIFALARRGVLSAGEAAEPVELNPDDRLYLGPFLAACAETAVSAVREEWPFIARLLTTGSGLRPASLLLAGVVAAGAHPRAELAGAGAAMDLAALGALSLIGAPEAGAPDAGATMRGRARGVDWESAVTVLACDFLLSQAARLVAESAPEASWAFADWLAELTRIRAERIADPGTTDAGDLFAALFEFPVRIGAQLGGAGTAVMEALREFGAHCGRAFLLAEDVLALRGGPTRLATTTRAMLAARTSMIPQLLGMPGLTGANEPHGRATALAAASRACRAEIDLALRAASRVPVARATRILRAHVLTISASIDAPSADVMERITPDETCDCP
ncbi:lycopene cyclase family protein [Nonomuraea sp. NPDC052129]|uniref:lycopene cyclase family protein n=1 Tax=Nonomuraea sp. NPDC052129 TaxID=3154651 RepID=UPI003422A605